MSKWLHCEIPVLKYVEWLHCEIPVLKYVKWLHCEIPGFKNEKVVALWVSYVEVCQSGCIVRYLSWSMSSGCIARYLCWSVSSGCIVRYLGSSMKKWLHCELAVLKYVKVVALWDTCPEECQVVALRDTWVQVWRSGCIVRDLCWSMAKWLHCEIPVLKYVKWLHCEIPGFKYEEVVVLWVSCVEVCQRGCIVRYLCWSMSSGCIARYLCWSMSKWLHCEISGLKYVEVVALWDTLPVKLVIIYTSMEHTVYHDTKDSKVIMQYL